MGVVECGEIGREGGKEDGSGSTVAIGVVEEVPGCSVVADALSSSSEGGTTDEGSSGKGSSGGDGSKQSISCVF